MDADACLTEIIDRWTLRLWRRPASDTERARLKAVGDQARDVLGAFDECAVRHDGDIDLATFCLREWVGENAADVGGLL